MSQERGAAKSAQAGRALYKSRPIPPAEGSVAKRGAAQAEPLFCDVVLASRGIAECEFAACGVRLLDGVCPVCGQEAFVNSCPYGSASICPHCGRVEAL